MEILDRKEGSRIYQSSISSELAEELSCQIVASFKDLGAIREEWDKFVGRVHGVIYMTYDWCRIWWEQYGENCKLRIFIFRENKMIIGIIPMVIDDVGMGLFRLRIARIMGSNLPPKISDLPVEGKRAEAIFEIVIKNLINDGACDVVGIGPISGTYQLTESLRRACARHPELARIVRDTNIGPHTVFTLCDNYDDYLNSLTKKERDKAKYEMRLLKKTFTVQLDVVKEFDRVEAEFLEFRRLHDRKWQSEGYLGHFSAWPKAEQFNLALALSQGRQGRFRLFKLVADGRAISYQYAYEFNGCYYWRLTAREVGAEWNRFSLGRVGLCGMIEYGINEGVRKIEGGLGHYQYKLQLGAKEHPVQMIVVAASRIGVDFRFFCFSVISSIIDLIYQKLWIRRLAPRVRRKRRPLSMVWIRTRL